MGYYSNQQPGQSGPEKKKSGWGLPIIIGLVVGILLMLVIYPNLAGKNVAVDDDHANRDRNGDSKSEVITEQPVQVDVTTQITEIVERVSPAVVGVTNIQMRSNFWQQGENSEAGTGSGVIYKKDDDYAYIVTNQHVVNQADMVEIVFNDDTTLEAELLGTDIFTDLAVLRVDVNKVEADPIEMGVSESLKVGEPVIAIGNPLGHMFAGSVTQGIISGKLRTLPVDLNSDGRADWQADVIQTDAAINPGNSGGALINIQGQLIGINSMKINQNVAQGIGFAIPIDMARPIIDQLESTGKVVRPFLGVEIYSLEEVPKVEWKNTLKLPDSVEGGVYIWGVEPLSPADQAGLKRLDVITEFAGKKVLNILELRKILYQDLKVGEEVTIVYYRDGERMEASLTLGEQK